MAHIWHKLVVAIVAAAGLLGAGASVQAQTEVRVGTRYAPSPGFLSFVQDTPYYTAVVAPDFNGHDPRFHAFHLSTSQPTYLTSINYPTIYGAYGYGYAPGRLNWGLIQSEQSTKPTVYNLIVPVNTTTLTPVRLLPEAAASAAATTAAIEVRLPANAELQFDGQTTTQGGPLRRFVTPPLERGTRYAYDLRASWPQGRSDVSNNRHVEFVAGDRVVVDFTVPPPTSGTSTLRTRELP